MTPDPLPLGTLVRYRPHHPGGTWHPCRWRIIEVCVRHGEWQIQPPIQYTLRCEEMLPGADAMDYVVRPG